MGNLDYDEIQAKLNPTADQKESNEADLTDLDDDKLDVKEEEEDLEDKEDEEEEEEEEAEEKPEVKPVGQPDATGLTATQQEQARQDILKVVGKDTFLVVKGVQKRASDLTASELVNVIQKGMRGDQIFNELSQEKKRIAQDKMLIEQQAQELLRAMQTKGGPATSAPQLPDYLKPTVDDTDEVRTWKQSQVQMLDKMNAMESYIQGQDANARYQNQVKEVLDMRKDYPVASVDEVIAIKMKRPDIDTEELMRASHNYYSSKGHFDEVFKANPTLKREYDESVINAYLAKKKIAPRIPGKRPLAGNVDRVSTQKKPKIMSFDDADNLSRAFMKEVTRLEKE